MTMSIFLVIIFLCLALLIVLSGYYIFFKKQRSSVAVSDRTCVMDVPEVAIPKLEIIVPIEWQHKIIEGPEFYVHTFNTPDSEGNLSIYIGSNPSMKEQATSQKFIKSVGGRKTTFFSVVSGQTTVSQAIIKKFFDDLGISAVSTFLLHIMIVEQKSGFTKEAYRVLKTLKILK
jgi:hypothetical protein